MAETMAPQRVKRIMQYTPEQFCKVNIDAENVIDADAMDEVKEEVSDANQ